MYTYNVGSGCSLACMDFVILINCMFLGGCSKLTRSGRRQFSASWPSLMPDDDPRTLFITHHLHPSAFRPTASMSRAPSSPSSWDAPFYIYSLVYPRPTT